MQLGENVLNQTKLSPLSKNISIFRMHACMRATEFQPDEFKAWHRDRLEMSWISEEFAAINFMQIIVNENPFLSM